MRVAALIFLGLWLVGCVTANEPELAAVRSAWGDCVATAVRRLDDGKSDPLSIAVGVSPQCAVQYEALTEMMLAPYTTEEGRENIRQGMKDNEIKLITSAILIFRSSHQTNQANRPSIAD